MIKLKENFEKKSRLGIKSIKKIKYLLLRDKMPNSPIAIRYTIVHLLFLIKGNKIIKIISIVNAKREG